MDLLDYTKDAKILLQTTKVGSITAANAIQNSSGNEIDFPFPDGKTATASLIPYKFVVPAGVTTGTHKITITESGAGAKSASFNLEVVSRVLTVAPATAAPGQSITVIGTGFKKSGNIEGTALDSGNLTARADGTITVAILNHAANQDISIDAAGAWAYVTRMPTLEAFASAISAWQISVVRSPLA